MHNYRDVLMIPKIKKTLTRLKINIKFTSLKGPIEPGSLCTGPVPCVIFNLC